MKIIVSHDIDHLTLWEHRADLIIPKYKLRSMLEWIHGAIPTTEFFNRWLNLFTQQWQHLENVITFNKKMGIPSTFFIAVRKGEGLAYPISWVNFWIPRLKELGAEVGIHGIEHQNIAIMQEELETFQQISRQGKIGIRMHYLRRDEATLGKLAQLGYMFDSSYDEWVDCYRIHKMWEFPLHIMDVYEIFEQGRYQKKPIRQIIKQTQSKIDKANESNFRYLTFLFHDRYYNHGDASFKQWYEESIMYMIEKGYTFCNYTQAIEELEADL